MTKEAQNLPSGFTIFCDDIRQEINGKVTFVGIYANTLFIADELPVNLPKLCMGIFFRQKPENSESFIVRVFGPNSDEAIHEFNLANSQDEFPSMKEWEFKEWRMFFEAPGFPVNQEGKVKVRAYIGDDVYRIGALKIQRAPAITKPD